MTKLIASTNYTGLVLAVHPTAYGFGWVLFESPTAPVAWSLVRSRAGKDQRLVIRFKRLLERYEPAVLVLEAYEDGSSRRGPRIQRLCRMMMRAASACHIKTVVFDRETIGMVFAEFGAGTREQIARVVAEKIDAFSHRLPPPRRSWNSVDPRQSLFDAAALAITYFSVMGEHDWSE